jgi:putative ABC transport system substrate-binding protein
MSMPFLIISCTSCDFKGTSMALWGRFSYTDSAEPIPLRRQLAWCAACNGLVSLEVLPTEASIREPQAREPNGGLIVMPDSFTDTHRVEITSLAARYHLPAVYAYRFFTKLGGLLSYGVDLTDNFRRAAIYVDLILKGAKPSDLPVQAPVKYELVINLKTAKELGLTVPQSLLLRADEVIE